MQSPALLVILVALYLTLESRRFRPPRSWLARDPAKLSDCSKAGVVVRLFNYNEEETLRPALAGVERLLFISGSEHGSSHVDGRHRLSLGDNGNGRFKGKNADRGASGTTRF